MSPRVYRSVRIHSVQPDTETDTTLCQSLNAFHAVQYLPCNELYAEAHEHLKPVSQFREYVCGKCMKSSRVSGRLCVKLEKSNPAMTLQHITETMAKLSLKSNSHTSW
jgi:hypothetical protein